MALYFQKFPRVNYQINDFYSIYATNIVSRFAFEEKFKNNTVAYYKYIVNDGETPEIISYKIYGAPEKHWIILYMNDIIDPLHDWPLPYDNFNQYIISKYGSIEYAQTNVHSYYKVITDEITNTPTTRRTFEIDSITYGDLPSFEYKTPVVLPDGKTLTQTISKETKSFYDYEVEVNDKKREIKILKSDFIPVAEREFERLSLL